MIWLAALTSALSLQSAEPVTAECQLSWEQARNRWAPTLLCPQDVQNANDLQSVAEQALPARRIRIESYRAPSSRTVSFVNHGAEWRLDEITPLYRSPPLFPADAAADAIAGRCRGIVELRPNGQRRRDSWSCRTNDPAGINRHSHAYAQAASEAARNSYWLVPAGTATPCVTLDFEFNLQDPDGSTSEAPDFPDAEAPQCSG